MCNMRQRRALCCCAGGALLQAAHCCILAGCALFCTALPFAPCHQPACACSHHAPQGYGSKALSPSSPLAAGGSGTGGGAAAGGASAAEQAEAPAAPGEAAGGDSSSGRARMWVDRWSEKELAPGVWLVRYMELHQPFVGE